MDDDILAGHLAEWGLLTHAEVVEAREVQKKLDRTGKRASLEEVLVAHGFLTRPQLDEAISAVELPSPDEELPNEVTEAMRSPDAQYGHYVLLGEVGRGGLGVVHRAWDTETRRVVALKFLKTEANLDSERVMELLLEGSRLSRLRHPNIITVHEFGQIRDQFYIAMELLEGMGLDQLMRAARARHQFSPFYNDPKRYLRVLRDVARAVHFMHTRNPPIVHCDLKPHNICVDFSWRPYLVDFGLARELRPAGAGVATEGSIRGSPSYMAPEQALGKLDEIDVRTDVYGLGAILYELLTGRPPYAGELQNVLDQNVLIEPPTPTSVVAARVAISSQSGMQPTVPPEIEALCLKAIAKDKKNRFPSARALADALDPLVADRPLRVRTPTQKLSALEVARTKTARKVAPPKRSRLWIPLAAGAAALLAVVGIAGIFMKHGPVEPRAVTEEERQRQTVGRKFDGYAARLDLDRAVAGYQQFQLQRNDTETNDWVGARIAELDILRQFRMQLAATLTRERPTTPNLKLRSGGFRRVTVTEASLSGLVVAADGSVDSVEIPWTEIDPAALLKFVHPWLRDFADEARMGAAVFAAKNGLKAEARELLEGSKDPRAAKYRETISEKE